MPLQGEGGPDAERRRASTERAQALLEGFSLTASEAKALVAVTRLGSSTVPQLAPLAGIGSTNLYPVLESLAHQQLVEKVPGRVAVWKAIGRDEVLWRLRKREEERHGAAEAALAEVGEAMEEVPEAKQSAAAAFRITDEPTLIYRYQEAIAAASHRLLVFNRGPYVGDTGVDQRAVEAVGRGVDARALWQAHELSGPGNEQVLRSATGYLAAGVHSRVVEELPLALAVIDSLTLTSVPADPPYDLPYIANVVVDNRAYANAMARLFETFWDQGAPLERSRTPEMPTATVCL